MTFHASIIRNKPTTAVRLSPVQSKSGGSVAMKFVGTTMATAPFSALINTITKRYGGRGNHCTDRQWL